MLYQGRGFVQFLVFLTKRGVNNLWSSGSFEACGKGRNILRRAGQSAGMPVLGAAFVPSSPTFSVGLPRCQSAAAVLICLALLGTVFLIYEEEMALSFPILELWQPQV